MITCGNGRNCPIQSGVIEKWAGVALNALWRSGAGQQESNSYSLGCSDLFFVSLSLPSPFFFLFNSVNFDSPRFSRRNTNGRSNNRPAIRSNSLLFIQLASKAPTKERNSGQIDAPGQRFALSPHSQREPIQQHYT